ncbi:MAG TPA: exodeoxyribonuclease VII large subunit [Chloroflexota bacterium]|nr:exodeoxyribonuclease VII large subunit [Chloroflexota bacterium]
MASPAPIGAHFFRIEELVAYIRDLFANDPVLSDVWVTGEIADVTRSTVGHAYFTVRDERSRISAVMFRSALRRQTLPLVAGFEALIHGSVSIYDQRSTFQLVADVVLPGDAGRLHAEFELLRRRLEQEGLFASQRKRPIPRMPRRIGIVTSESGAVLHDILNVLNRRYRCVELIFAPAGVQGEDAPRQIVAALDRLNAFHADRRPLDLIILARGGGAAEELAVFNDERVARAIFASAVPIVSAIGHEVDVTIADLVADLRAPTPSAAAEMVVPDAAQLCEETRRTIERGSAALHRMLGVARMQVQAAEQQLDRHSPARTIGDYRRALDDLGSRGKRAIRAVAGLARSRVEMSRSQLAALSPETTLARGYAVCSRTIDGSIVTGADQVSLGERIAVRLARGQLVGDVLDRSDGVSGDVKERSYAEQRE